MNQELKVIAERISGEGIFTGGPVRTFESHGRNQFVRLLNHGLNPDSKLLDIGCGCLRGGYWTIRFLDRGGYHGIEPNMEMLRAGQAHVIGRKLKEVKVPRFDNNDQFDFGVFDQKFDFVMAGSIWTHAPKWAIEEMLRQFAKTGNEGAIMLASFRRTDGAGYTGKEWVGKSHKSDKAGLVSYNVFELRELAEVYDLQITDMEFGKKDICWLKIERKKL